MTIELLNLFILTILQGCLNAVMVISFTKWGWIGAAQTYAPPWMPFNCPNFCLPFWLSIIQLIILFSFSNLAAYILLVAFMSPALTQKLINETYQNINRQ